MSSRVSLLVVVSAFGCGGESATRPDATPDGFDRSALLEHLGASVLLPLQGGFAVRASELPNAVDAYCSALDTGSVGATQAAARTAWASATDAWERADALLVGPAAMDNRALRDRIYSWPLLSTCGIDRDTAARWASSASYDITTKLANVRSLAAIEYLLFAITTNHTCATSPTGWDALAADLPRARCRLASVIAHDVAAAAVTLHAAWRPDGGDFVGELARAGEGSSIRSAHEGVNRITDGMFYIDRMVKDMKLGEAAGLAVNACGTVMTPCLREVELQYGDRASFAIRANLLTLREAFTGTTAAASGPGFDDFLIAVGHPELAERMLANLDGAIAKAAALPDSFLGALSTDYPSVVAAHTAIKLFTDDLKSQFLTVLALEIPDDVAADND